MTINYLTTDSSKLRHLITRRSPTTETQQPIDRKWSVKPILRSIQIYAGIALRFDRKSALRRAMKPGPDVNANHLIERNYGNSVRFLAKIPNGTAAESPCYSVFWNAIYFCRLYRP